MISSLLFLGTGSSIGIPVIGCDCSVCRSKAPFNKRLRSSALVRIGDKRILLDVGPDFRAQALTHHIKSLDGVILTHAHQDHVGGLDDLRAFFINRKTPLSLLMSKETSDDVESRFYYLFKPDPQAQLTPKLQSEVLPLEAGGLKFKEVGLRYFSYKQLGMKVTGFRFGDLAYVTDIQEFDESIFEELSGVKTLVLSALREAPSHMHFTIEEACNFAKKVGAKETYLTHIAHELEHLETTTKLPPGIRLAYDGLEIPFTGY